MSRVGRAGRATRLVGWGTVTAGVAALSWLMARNGISAESTWPLLILAGLVCLIAVEGAVVVGSAWSEARAERSAGVFASVAGDGPERSAAIRDVESASIGVERSTYRRFVGLIEGRSQAKMPSRRDRRGNPRLLGRVVVVSIFVGKDGRSWTDRELAAGHEAIERAADWLKREASLRSVPLRVALADVFFQADDFVDEPAGVAYGGAGDNFAPAEIDAAVKLVAMGSRCAAHLGFRDLVDLCSAIEAGLEGEADAVAWLVHLKRAGQSMAILADDRLIDGVSLAVCYAAEASFSEPLEGPARIDPVTVVHEILHLFGASDTYNVPIDRFAAGTVSRRDVMRLDLERLSELIVGDHTAREVGWGRFAPRTQVNLIRPQRRKKRPGPRRRGRGPGRARPGEKLD